MNVSRNTPRVWNSKLVAIIRVISEKQEAATEEAQADDKERS